MGRQKGKDLFVKRLLKIKASYPLLFGIFGYKIGYSISPLLHNKTAKALNLDFCYSKFDVKPDDFPSAFNGFKALKLKGANITKPYKEVVLKYLDKLSKESSFIGAVNTVNLQRDGSYMGYNTDSAGFVNSIDFEFGAGLKDKNIILMGAGGASKAILYSAIKEGAKNVFIINRDIDRVFGLFNKALSWAKEMKAKTLLNYSDFTSFTSLRRENGLSSLARDQGKSFTPFKCHYDLFRNCDIIISAITPSEGAAQAIQNLPLNCINKDSLAMDIAYNPVVTPFMRLVQKRGIKCVNGLSMLVFQAIESFYIWTGKRVDFDFMVSAAKQ